MTTRIKFVYTFVHVDTYTETQTHGDDVKQPSLREGKPSYVVFYLEHISSSAVGRSKRLFEKTSFYDRVRLFVTGTSLSTDD